MERGEKFWEIWCKNYEEEKIKKKKGIKKGKK